MSERFAVTGGAGFIGSQLVRTLLSHGADRVVVIDNLLTGRARNLDGVRGNVDFHNLDIRDYDGTLSVLNGCDYAVHLAAIPSVPRSIEDPVPSHDPPPPIPGTASSGRCRRIRATSTTRRQATLPAQCAVGQGQTGEALGVRRLEVERAEFRQIQ